MEILSPVEAKKRSLAIDRELKKEGKKLRDIRKLLLLGTAETGKSTVLKQMKLIHSGGLSDYDAKTWVDVIHLNTLQSIVAIADALATFRIPLGNPNNQTHLDNVLALREQEKNLTASLLTPELQAAVLALWPDTGIQATFARRNEYTLLDWAGYFLSDAARLFKPDFAPTTDDILRGRLPTSAVTETRMNMGGMDYRIYDVAGARADRHAWMPFFDDCQAIIFLVSTSSYDQILSEDTTITRLVDSMGVFEQVANHVMLAKTHIILFLNKIDLLEEKLKIVPLEKHFPEYQPPAALAPGVKAKLTPTEHACKFMSRKFAQLNRVKEKKLYIYNTSATDSKQIKVILSTVNRIILKMSLQLKDEVA